MQELSHERGWRLKGTRPDEAVERRLGEPFHELMQVHLVDLIAPPAIGAHAAGEDQHGDAVEKRLADPARRMREARSRHDDEGADARREPAHRICHERGAAFVRHQDGRDAVRAVELVVQLGVLHARNAEREPDPDLLEGIDRKRRAGAFHVRSESAGAPPIMMRGRCCGPPCGRSGSRRPGTCLRGRAGRACRRPRIRPPRRPRIDPGSADHRPRARGTADR